ARTQGGRAAVQVHPQILRAGVPRHVHASAGPPRDLRGRPERPLRRQLGPDARADTAHAGPRLPDGPDQDLALAPGRPSRRVASRVVALRRYAFTIVGI